jgi:hypothetical protein
MSNPGEVGAVPEWTPERDWPSQAWLEHLSKTLPHDAEITFSRGQACQLIRSGLSAHRLSARVASLEEEMADRLGYVEDLERRLFDAEYAAGRAREEMELWVKRGIELEAEATALRRENEALRGVRNTLVNNVDSNSGTGERA